MTLTLFKLLATPVFIGLATLAGRRWGPVVNGLVVGLPLTTGPISVILARQYGLPFAARAAAGNLAGQVSMCVFCLTYGRLAQRRGWLASAGLAVAAYGGTTFLLNRLTWSLWPALGLLAAAIVMVNWLLPAYPAAPAAAGTPPWDVPARMVVATTFVILLTTAAQALGPQLSGLVSTFPIFGVVFAAFTQAQQGPQAAANLLRGVVLGSAAYAAFFVTVGAGLLTWGIGPTYGLAVAAALTVSGMMYAGTHRVGSGAVRP